jgi:Tfp pilus assembly protein PilW
VNIKKHLRRPQRGMSLIEILVGVLIGMIAIIVIFQVLAVYEDRKRTATGAGDAQSTGAIALYMLDRDVRMGGYGFGNADAMGCVVKAFDVKTGTGVDFTLAPVVISKPNGAEGPDSIVSLYGNSMLFAARKAFTSSTDTTKVMQSGNRPGFLRGDLAVVTTTPAPATCALIEVTDNTDIDTVTLGHAEDGTYTSDYSATAATVRYNKIGGPGVSFTQGFAYNLGPSPTRTVWSINSNRLSFTDSLHSDSGAIQVADGVVNMKAEYGIDANNNNQLEQNEWTTADPITPAGWQALRAVRVALLLRSGQWDRSVCSTNPQWTSGTSGTPTLTNFVMRNVDGSNDAFVDCDGVAADPNNWRTYRYRVYETVIPLRNMIWGTAP